jgi:hypothetical protein
MFSTSMRSYWAWVPTNFTQSSRQRVDLRGKLLGVARTQLRKVVKLPANAWQMFEMSDPQQRPLGRPADQRHVRADPNLSHPADRILSRGWKPTF